MEQLSYINEVYRTDPKRVPFLARIFPRLTFYRQFFGVILDASAKSKRGRYDDAEWCRSSINIFRSLENTGVCFEITGIENIINIDTPCIIIANHMSTLETVTLPIIIHPIRKVTFIIKQDLLEYPIFKHIMRARDPIAVSRTNPRQDLKAVMEGGVERLKNDTSIIVFPQTTRMPSIDPTQFNTIGIKLAKKADVPIIPLALLSDAWGTGKYIKDLGKIDPSKSVHFSFGEPMRVQGRGTDEHQAIIHFIESKLEEWRAQRSP
jgi:1-acyl-sn-glycerol-3-phosphate acyltransferase